MSYASALDMAVAFGYKELAERATPDDYNAGADKVTADLMRLTISGGDRASFTAGQVTAADEALARINKQLDYASREIDAAVSTHNTLPLSSISARPLEHPCLVLARFFLFDDKAPESIAKPVEQVRAWLESIRDGKLTLSDNQNPSSPSSLQVSTVLRV